jgi:hypothetical protein
MTDWSEEPFLVWKLILYKEDDKGNQKFYTTNENFNHSEIAEWDYNENKVTEITVDEA